ncbi:MAG: hypothetical protein L0332_29260 [Chloroflexi bacterium]|nr:hypothetical protein [Chloroflexota bacterium]MCI0646829.1 hypothetical protein [Chloroflexota bacterium]MCI0730790.1 hypothetical protein [Chloroflexota bacterium]
MSEIINGITMQAINTPAEGMALLEKLVAAGRAEAVYSQLVAQGEYAAMTAAEVSITMGFGFGGGGEVQSAPAGESSEAANDKVTGGGGGGGGGVSMARPVAVVAIGPHGVRVEPVVDTTKIALAFFTTLITILTLLGQARRQAEQ